MEFLKTCSTNAQALGDFEAVAFQAFSVTRNTTHPLSNARDWSPSEDIRAVEGELRQALQLVVQDATRPWIWFFKATTADKAGQTSIELPTAEGYHLHLEQSGLMKSSELARPPLRSVNPNASSGSTSSPSTVGPTKAFQGGGGRPAQGSAGPDHQQQPHDSFAIYELFTSSVVALVSYHLVNDRQAVALNYRTFVSKPAVPLDSDELKVNPRTEPHWLTNINVYWASSGTLIISTFTQTNHEIHCLDEISTESQQHHLIGKCIRVAPNGILAQIASFDDPIDAIAEEFSQRSSRKRARISSAEQGLERWMSIVQRWLAWKGYSLPNLTKRSSWVRIRIAQLSQSPMPTPSLATQAREIFWPRALCFYYSTTEDTSSFIESSGDLISKPYDEVLEWYQTENSHGFNDPLDVAQQWFLGKPEREKATEARRKAKKAEEEAARPKEEPGGLYPSSPLNFRTGAYGDLQSVSGVYPTPPDGVVPGTVVSNADTPSVSGMTTNMILAPGGVNPAINLSAPQDDAHDGQQLPLTSPDFPLAVDHFGTSAGDDDLFEDMDEDGFEGNGVTDADFSFFDEPDGDDVDMLDAPAAQESKSAHAENASQVKGQPLSLSFDAEVKKEESSDPLAALEDALASASHTGKDGVDDIKGEQALGDPMTKASDQAETTSKQPTISQGMDIVSARREPTPPLSPHSIEKLLFPSSQEKPAFQTPHRILPNRQRDSIFDPLSFNRKMSLSDAKYQDGRFSSRHEKETNSVSESNENPRQIKSLKDLPLLTKIRYAIGVASAQGIPELATMGTADSDESDATSDASSASDEDMDDSLSLAPIPSPAALILPAKRKLPTEGNATPMSTTSFAESVGADYQDFTGLHVDEASLVTFEPNSWDWSLVSFPPPAELPLNGARYSIPCFSPVFPSLPDTPTSQPDLTDGSDEKPLSGKDSIAVAQIVTDQIISATLDLLHDMEPKDVLSATKTSLEDKWHGVIKTVFPKAAECNVPALAAVHDVFPDLSSQAKGQQRAPPRKANESTAIPGNHIYQINVPYIRLRRADTLWDLLPPALAFWEPLGLGPVSPPKNVVAFCIYPHSDSLKPCVENFILNLQLAYDSCKLGSHTQVETILPEYENGMVPCKVNLSATPRSVFKALRETCIQLGKTLAATHSQVRGKQDAKIDAFVIYMVDPFGNPAAIWDLCSAFWTLFQSYGQGPPARPDLPQKPDLVLQIVPIKHIASFEAPVILDAAVYANLAREVYDRCPPSAASRDKTPLTIYTAPSFHLEEALPRNVPFKLVSDPPQDLLRENSYMHLGYAISLDGTWVTAAWTDNSGKSQAVVSYHLGTRMFGEVAKEIWQTTIEILQSRRVHWRVCVAKSGVMDREELETWVFLISCPTQLNLFITLLTVETEPPLKFSPSIPSTNSTTGANASGNTPGSTPQAGVSPDTHGLTPAATPSADPPTDPAADPEARLTDITDESWGIILAHRVHNSNSTNQFSPALISGLLVKRGETYATLNSNNPNPEPEHGPIIVGVNILWIGAVGSTRAAQSPFPPAASGEGISPGGAPSPQERSTSSLMWTPTVQTRATAENLLKEVLGQFRALGLLARLKGMRGTRHGTIPWHVAAAKRGVNGVSRVLNGV